MIVKVTEVDPICAMQACMDGFEVVSPFIDGINNGTEASIDKALLGKIDLIVTTTGNVNVCDANMLKALKKRAVVCNIGHFDNEIDTAFMRKNWAREEVKPQVHKIHRTGAGSFDPQNDDYLILLAEGHWSTWVTPLATQAASWTVRSPTRYWRRSSCSSRSSPTCRPRRKPNA